MVYRWARFHASMQIMVRLSCEAAKWKETEKMPQSFCDIGTVLSQKSSWQLIWVERFRPWDGRESSWRRGMWSDVFDKEEDNKNYYVHSTTGRGSEVFRICRYHTAGIWGPVNINISSILRAFPYRQTYIPSVYIQQQTWSHRQTSDSIGSRTAKACQFTPQSLFDSNSGMDPRWDVTRSWIDPWIRPL